MPKMRTRQQPAEKLESSDESGFCDISEDEYIEFGRGDLEDDPYSD